MVTANNIAIMTVPQCLTVHAMPATPYQAMIAFLSITATLITAAAVNFVITPVRGRRFAIATVDIWLQAACALRSIIA